MRFDPIASYAKSVPGNPAVVDMGDGRSWTYRELDAAIDRLAAWLVAELGPNSGARTVTLSKNCAEMVILQYAAVRAGSIFVPFNWRLASAEIEALAADAEPAIAFVQDGFAAPPSARRSIPIADMLDLGSAGSSPPAEARRPFEDVSCLLYTSGTSGRPKGVMLSERNAFWGATGFILGNEVSMHSRFLCDMPLFHTAGLHAACRAPIQAGACVYITPGFDPVLTLERLSDPELGITHYFSVPQMAATLWNQPSFDAEKLRNIKVWAIGGAPNPKAQSERYAGAGIRIGEGFGMSETGSNFGMPTSRLDVLLAKAGSCGLPWVTIEPKIVDDDGNEVPVGETGELWLRGPSVAQGYWNQPELTAKAFRDGWFLTGDAAMMDEDGFFYIMDRKKDMYISGGENVYPAEVEAALAELPEVGEAAIVGVPDERWGEVGRAYVIPVPGREITAEQVIAHCAARLAKFKVPKTAVITDEIPRTASGKVQKHLLLERAKGELALG
ncbi:AMP-binding protein [Altererythrobacter sp.]|uniref:AMP-binding protein n=1 Tax=Altererythrobacter sp. TaxID=1872480 RepID=UPI003D140E90